VFHEAIIRALENGTDLSAAMVEAAAPMREIIQHMLRRRPFQPFRIRMTSRHIEDIRNPERVKVGPTTLHLFAADPTQPGKLRDSGILALIHVVSLEPLIEDEPTVVENAPQGDH
jgi:hypothetical protein